MRLMGECRGSMDAARRAEEELTEEEDDARGLTNPTSAETQSAGGWRIHYMCTDYKKHTLMQGVDLSHFVHINVEHIDE